MKNDKIEHVLNKIEDSRRAIKADLQAALDKRTKECAKIAKDWAERYYGGHRIGFLIEQDIMKLKGKL